ncbi:MAG TPA: M14 family metallopeptidase [Kofleriaceae bacterium]|nr:M14 family metallopeptidase [Kofleriaceae bacterium]
MARSASSPLADWAATLDEPSAADAVRLPYRTYAATWRALAALPPRARASRIGLSAGGEPLWAVTVEPRDPARATTFVVAGLHAMEHVGVATAVALLERAAGPTSAWRDQRLVVVPMGNPDGFRLVEADLARGARRFRRANARGVDLNRNFAVGWDDRYYLNRLLGRVFSPGAGPLSEPETSAIDALLAGVRPTHAVSLHAFGEWIFVPYAGSRRPPPHIDRLLEIARGMTAAQPERPYRVLQLARRSRFFQARGAEIDHFYERHGALSFLVEIGAGPRLRAPPTWFLPYGWFTPPGELLERDVANVLPALEHLATL